MACERRVLASGWFEADFRGNQAQQAMAWVEAKRRWLKKTFRGLCEKGCRLVVKERVSQTPIFTSASTKRFTIRFEFEVRCQ